MKIRSSRPAAVRRRPPLSLEILEDRIAPALHITFNFGYDKNGFFNTQEKQIALKIAGAMLTSRLEDHFAAIQPSAHPGFSWVASFPNPATGIDTSRTNLPIGDDEILVFAGGRALPIKQVNGQTYYTLGVGGPGNYGSASGDDAWYSTVFGRGQPGAYVPSGQTPTDEGRWGGAITFSTVFQNWYFGTGPAPAGQTSLISVAVHELGHLLGLFRADSAAAQMHNGSFTGPAAEQLYGQAYGAYYNTASTPRPVPMEHDLGHFLNNDPVVQSFFGNEARMDPVDDQPDSFFTALDWAAMQDIGYQVSPSDAQIAIRFLQNGQPLDGVHGLRISQLDSSASGVESSEAFYNVVGAFTVLALPSLHSAADSVGYSLQASQGPWSFVPAASQGQTVDIPHGFSVPFPPQHVQFWDANFTQAFRAAPAPVGLGLTDADLGQANDLRSAPTVGALSVGGLSSDGADAITVALNSDTSANRVTVDGVAVEQPKSKVTQISVAPGGGDDALTVDFRNGSPLPAGGLTYDGGPGNDSLTIKGGHFTNTSYTRFGDDGSGSGGSSGALLLDGVPVSFSDVELVALQFTTRNLALDHARLLAGGSFAVTGSLVLGDGSALAGDGFVGAALDAGIGSRVAPGEGTGNLRGKVEVGSTTLRNGSTFALEVDANSTGTLYDRLSVDGTLSILNATLDVHTATPAPQLGQRFIFISNDGKDPIQGTFAGLPEGATFTADGYRFQISYKAGDGNDVSLTALNNAPSFGQLTLSSPYVSDAGSDILTVTAGGFGGGRVDGVEFWLDTNQNGRIDTSSDRLLRDVQSMTGPYSYTGVISGVSAGTYQIIARAYSYTSSAQNFSDPVSATLQVTASPPVDPRSVTVGTETRANYAQGTAPHGGAFVRYDSHGTQDVFWTEGSDAFIEQFSSGGGIGIGQSLNAINGTIDDVALAEDGSFLVVWENAHLYVSRFDNGGNFGGFTQQLDTGAFRNGSARLSVIDTGTWAVAWEQGGYFDGDIYLRRYSNGSLLSSGTVNSVHPATAPAVALDPAGNCFVVWTDTDSGGFGSYVVRGRVFGPSGSATAGPFVVSAAGETINYVDSTNDVAALSNGGFVVAYSAGHAATGQDIVVRRYTADGSAVDAAGVVANRFLGNDQLYPRLGTFRQPGHDPSDNPYANRFIVAWDSLGQEVGQSAYESGVYAQAFESDLTRVGGSFLVNTTTPGNQYVRSVAVDGAGGFVVGWNGNGVGDANGAFYQDYRFNSPPTALRLLVPYVDESMPAGTLFSPLGVTDPDHGDQFVYQLVDGPGLDSSAFSITGKSLMTATTFSYAAKSVYHVRIRVTDNGGAGYALDQDFFIRVQRTIVGAVGVTRSAAYTDADGDTYTVALTGPGTLLIGLNDPDGDGKGSIGRLTLKGSSPQTSSLSVSVTKAATGDGAVSIGQLSVQGGSFGLRTLSLKSSDLTGGGLVANIGTFSLRDLKAGAFLLLTGTTATANFRTLEDASELDFGNLPHLNVQTIGQAALSGLSLGQLAVTGNVGGNLVLDGPTTATSAALTSATIGGDLRGATWTIHGQVGTVTVTGTADGVVLAVTPAVAVNAPNPQDGALGSFTANKTFNVNLSVAKAITTVSSRGWAGGRIEANTLGTLTSTGSFNGTVVLHGTGITATANTLSRVNVTGDTTNALFAIAGNVGTFSTGRFVNSALWLAFTPIAAGINPLVNPGNYLLGSYQLGTFSVTAAANAFQGGSVVADTFGAISIQSFDTSAGLPLFGIAVGTSYNTLRVNGVLAGRGGAVYKHGSLRVKLL